MKKQSQRGGHAKGQTCQSNDKTKRKRDGEKSMTNEEAARLWDRLLDSVHTGNAKPAKNVEDPDEEG